MVKTIRKVDIKDIFLGLQKQMHSKLANNKKILTHPVTKGDSGELEWISLLSTYLPSRYCADKAFVIDSRGHVSEQIDIVIYDRHYSPFILKQNGATYIPAESVYIVIEVKPVINSFNIKYASKKAESVRILKRTSAPIVHAEGRIEKPKKPFQILAGILATEGSCRDPSKLGLTALSRDRFLHFGCSLNEHSFWFKNSQGKQPCLDISSKNESLIFFFLNLLSELQQLGTVPAIDLNAYIGSFRS